MDKNLKFLSFKVIEPQIMPEHQFVPMPQVCLLCDSKFEGASLLAAHVFQVHGIDMAKVMEPIQDKKKKIPNLVKITDLKIKNDSGKRKDLRWHTNVGNISFIYIYKCKLLNFPCNE